jgi:hypothetical protein
MSLGICRAPERNRHGVACKEPWAKAGGLGPGDLLTVVFNGLNKTLVIERGSQTAMKEGIGAFRLHAPYARNSHIAGPRAMLPG